MNLELISIYCAFPYKGWVCKVKLKAAKSGKDKRRQRKMKAKENDGKGKRRQRKAKAKESEGKGK